MKSSPKFSAYVLAGGKSTRMGQDKGLMPLHKKPLISHVIEKLKPCFEQLNIVSNNPVYQQFGLVVLPDVYANRGPAAGILTGLQHSKTRLNFFVACDMPFITPQAVQWLLNEAEKSKTDITFPISDTGPEPLFAVYSQNIMPQLEVLVTQGTLKLRQILTHFTCNALPVSQNPLFSPYFFTNLNTPIQFNQALQNIQIMSLQILAFGKVAEIMGSTQLYWVEPVQDTDALKKAIEKEFPPLAHLRYAIAVNHQLIKQNTPLALSDKVMLLPPFSGG